MLHRGAVGVVEKKYPAQRRAAVNHLHIGQDIVNVFSVAPIFAVGGPHDDVAVHFLNRINGVVVIKAERRPHKAGLGAQIAQKMIKLLDLLEDLDDTQNVYSNADIPDDILAKL